MRGSLDAEAPVIVDQACIAAAHAITDDIAPDALRADNVPLTLLSETLYPAVSEAVAQNLAARGLARKHPAPGVVAEHTKQLQALVAERQRFCADRMPKPT